MTFARVDGRDVVADFGGGSITSDAGALLLGATERAVGPVDRFAACFSDGRMPGRITHDVATLVGGQRVFGIALGYEDLIDHDDLRRDPALGAALGRIEARRPGLAPLAGKSTLNRLEHAPAGPDRYRRIGMIRSPSRRCSSICSSTPTRRRPRGSRSTWMLPTIRSTGGRRAGSSTATTTAYLPLYIFCGDHLLAAKLRRANIDASAGATEEVARIVERIRARWPRVKILLPPTAASRARG
jgi:hypothetical protein